MTPCEDCNKCDDTKSVEWYKDKELEIIFSEKPCVGVRIIYPSMTKEEKKDIKNKTFICKKRLMVDIKYKDRCYCFVIPKFYYWNGANIPRLFWRLIGSKSEPSFLIPSMVHDILCENHHYIDNDRYLSSLIFRALLKTAGINPISRWAMFHSVDNFQKFQGW